MRIAVIPARGGSKRIPGKNIKLFSGKPIIAYSIEAALESGVVDRVIVSTDDEAIAKTAEALGAEVPFVRPCDISDDYTPTVPVIKHAIEWVAANLGKVSEVCCIYATAPFVTPNGIREAYARLMQNNVQGYVFTATTFPFPIQRAFRIKADGHCEMFHPELYNARSQDLEEAYQDAGQFYWGKSESYLNEIEFFSNLSMPFVIPRYRVQDIDTTEDWARAEIMLRVLNEESSKKA
ncbi:MAG: pseudaminic acid cytidylyltransferase [Deltaproteobacteria bacterium]|nr:pseudaminic acid cytidylyltransferase [Deltaproteobacteria bacterium]